MEKTDTIPVQTLNMQKNLLFWNSFICQRNIYFQYSGQKENTRYPTSQLRAESSGFLPLKADTNHDISAFLAECPGTELSIE